MLNGRSMYGKIVWARHNRTNSTWHEVAHVDTSPSFSTELHFLFTANTPIQIYQFDSSHFTAHFQANQPARTNHASIAGATTMWNHPFRKPDVEAGVGPRFPVMLEPPQLRWAFIRKVYSIISVQLLATVAVAAVVVSVRPIAAFFVRDSGGLALYILVIITPFISKFSLFFLFRFRKLFHS